MTQNNETKAAREFYVRPAWPTEVSISDVGACLERVPDIEKDRFVKKYIRVIEYSAYADLKAKHEELEKSRNKWLDETIKNQDLACDKNEENERLKAKVARLEELVRTADTIAFQSNDKTRELTEQLEVLKGALEFYANPDSYDTHASWGKVCIMEKDCEKGVREPFMNINCGGKTAREALSKVKGLG